MVLTPITLRAHKLSSSANLVFIDTTIACDIGSHSVTFILSPCAAGTVPLVVLITSEVSKKSYSAAFNLLKTTLPDAFGNQGFPNTATTDNAVAEMNATRNIWPYTNHVFCSYHVLQAIRCWLWDGANKTESDDRI